MPKRFKKSTKSESKILTLKENLFSGKQKIIDFVINYRFSKFFLVCLLLVCLGFGFWFGRTIVSDHYYKEALKYQSFGDNSKAIELSQKAIKIFPRDSDYWRLIGEIKSKQSLEKIKQTKQNSASQEEFAKILREDVGGALLYLQKAVEIDPDNWQNQFAVGAFYESLIGYIPDAEKQASFSYIHAAELRPDDISMQVAALRSLIFYTDRLDSEGRNNEKNQALLLAQNILNRIKTRKLGDNVYHFYNGLILLRSFQYDSAISELRVASSIFPDNAYLSYEIGLAYFAKGDTDNAKEYLSLKMVRDSSYGNSANKILEIISSRR